MVIWCSLERSKWLNLQKILASRERNLCTEFWKVGTSRSPEIHLYGRILSNDFRCWGCIRLFWPMRNRNTLYNIYDDSSRWNWQTSSYEHDSSGIHRSNRMSRWQNKSSGPQWAIAKSERRRKVVYSQRSLSECIR